MEPINIFDIRIQSTIEIHLPENPFGNIFILGHRSALSDKIAELQTSVIKNLDSSAVFYPYRLRLHESGNEDYNIVCPIKKPVSERGFYVVAKCEYDELDLAVSAVINEAEGQMRKFAEEAIVVAAMQDPDLFMSVVNKVIVEGYGDDNSKDGIYPFGILPMGAVAGAALGMALGIDSFDDNPDFCELTDVGIDADMIGGSPSKHEAALGIVKGAQKPKFGTISAKLKKQAFSNLPKRLTVTFEKQNSQDYEIAKQTMAMFTPKENMAILEQMYRENPEIFQKYYATALSASSRYEIHVRPWKSSYRSDFKDRYLYCIYLKNAKGKECPVTFKNYPAYCIYMMYIIDRVQRGDEVTDLIMKNLRKEFCQLYKTILSETDSNINNFFDGMDYRKVEESGKMRKGRYDDYIKDIHNTLEKLVGEFDSIPLKVGHGRYLGVMPDRIFIDEKLTKFKFA